MNNPVLILYLEDNPRDAELVRNQLQLASMACELRIASGRAEYEAALARTCFDLILSDYCLPDYDGLAALALARSKQPNVPFILISGTLGEEQAVDCLLCGATDYVLKQRLSRLVPAILRALVEAAERQKRRESEARYRALFNGSADGILIADIETKMFKYANPALSRMLGYTEYELQTMGVPDIHPKDAIQSVVAKFETLAHGNKTLAMDIPCLRKDGSVVYADINVTRITIDGRLWNAGFFRDITERKAAEEQIRAQAELLDLAQDAITVRDMNRGVQYWNKGCERLTGWTAAKAAGRPMDELLQPDRAVSERALRVLLEAGHWSGEIVVTTKDRRRVTLMSRWTLVRDEQGQPRSVLTISTDLTEYKKLEEQFLRAQRLESVGRLAGGIAHDLNNILAPILMGTSLLQEGLPLAEASPLIGTIARSAQRGADVVKQLLTFARGTDGQKVPLPPSRLIREMATIVQETFPKSITCRTEFPKDLWTILGDPTQLHQVLLNLCVNARDAMPEGGTLTLAAENVTLGDRSPA